MTDVVDARTRSRMMAGIRGSNTTPELKIRSHLHQLGFRFRLHDAKLPGRPDLVLAKYHAVIFIHGCFWHKHRCRFFKWPKTRPEFWKGKINQNRKRDLKTLRKLQLEGWRVCIVWECATRGADKDLHLLAKSLAKWLRSKDRLVEISE